MLIGFWEIEIFAFSFEVGIGTRLPFNQIIIMGVAHSCFHFRVQLFLINHVLRLNEDMFIVGKCININTIIRKRDLKCINYENGSSRAPTFYQRWSYYGIASDTPVVISTAQDPIWSWACLTIKSFSNAVSQYDMTWHSHFPSYDGQSM